jgi:CBS domain-containing protein
VVGQGGEVLGVISESDLLPRSADGPPRRRALAWLLDRDAHAVPDEPRRVVADAMSTPAITLEGFWTIPGAAHVMRERGVKRLPVVRGSRLVGIVSRADIVRAFARSDGEIERDVRELIDFQRALWSDELRVDIAVDGGEVDLSGAVERRTVADSLPALVARIPGVVTVGSHVSWRDDDRELSRPAR